MSCAEQYGVFISGNIQYRPVRPAPYDKEKGMPVGHEHDFDHNALCVTGRARVQLVFREGAVQIKDVGPGEWVLVPADVLHSVAALEPDTLVLCLYSHRDPQGEIVQEYTGWESTMPKLLADSRGPDFVHDNRVVSAAFSDSRVIKPPTDRR